ncbi:alpha/beta hydrolase [Georgenia ruanii]|nr:alpha/beta hydrolase [Georgenia ruanii]MPV87455.1 alpha/beta fold hydrolase [Georgenia ruanii]
MSWTMRRRAALAGVLLALLPGVAAAAAGAPPGSPDRGPAPRLTWSACGTTPAARAAKVQCATATLPMDYDAPDGAQVRLAVAKVPATNPGHRIGSLFFNLGGPGGPAVDYLQSRGAGLFAGLNDRFDIVGFDPRGVGQSVPAIDCHVDQETEGIYSLPVPTPLDIDVDAYLAKARSYVAACQAHDGAILAHVSTANVARDLDALRAAVGDQRLTYLGYSYGTVLGATYASMFPDRYRAVVLDSAVDAPSYLHAPMQNIADQTAGFEDALDRFLTACAADRAACSGFGGSEPAVAYDDLLAAAERAPIPAAGYAADPRPVTADDIRTATMSLLYAKQLWGYLALALAHAGGGDGALVRAFVDRFYDRRPDGTYAPTLDRYFTITAAEQDYPRDHLGRYLGRGARSWADYPHFWGNSGYAEISYSLWPTHDPDAYRGPFRVPDGAPTALVVNLTHDPATPYPGARHLVRVLGNARLLTVDGDGHGAYGMSSACVNGAAEAYLVSGTLPAAGTVCAQDVAFRAPQPVPAAASDGALADAVAALVPVGAG